MAGLTIPIGGDMAPFLAVVAQLKSQVAGMGKSVKSATNGMGASAKQATGGFKILKNEGNTTFRELASRGNSAASQIRSAFNSLKGSLQIGTMLGGAGVAAGVGGGIAKAISAAADFEGMRTAFMPLLGSADAAQARIDELAKFSADTPFEMPEVAKASRVLETLTRGALSTGAGLRLVGDVASGVGRPFDEVATTIGRLYDGLQSGRPVGEAMMRLQELGVISGETRSAIEALQESGAKGDSVWQVAASSLGKFSGSMALQSQTWSGKLSTLKDNVTQAFAAFGMPIIDAVKPFLDSAIQGAAKMGQQAVGFGQAVADTIAMMKQAFASGQIGSIVANSIQIAFGDAVNFLYAALRSTMAAGGQYIVEYFKTAISAFGILAQPSYWQGMGSAIVGVFLDAVGFLQRGLAEALELVRPLAEVFGKGDAISGAQNTLRDSAGVLRGEASAKYEDASQQLEPHYQAITNRLKEAGANIHDRFVDTFKGTEDIFDMSGLKKELVTTFQKLSDAVKGTQQVVDNLDLPSAAGSGESGDMSDTEGGKKKQKTYNQTQFLSDSQTRYGGKGFGMSFVDPRIQQDKQRAANPSELISSIMGNVNRFGMGGVVQAVQPGGSISFQPLVAETKNGNAILKRIEQKMGKDGSINVIGG